MEGSFEQLLVKVHFEKAKLQDLSGCPNEPKQFKGYIKSNAKFLQVVTRELMTSLFMAITTLRDAASVTVQAIMSLKSRSISVEAKGQWRRRRQQQQQQPQLASGSDKLPSSTMLAASGNDKLPSSTMLALQGSESTRQDHESGDGLQQAQEQVAKL